MEATTEGDKIEIHYDLEWNRAQREIERQNKRATKRQRGRYDKIGIVTIVCLFLWCLFVHEGVKVVVWIDIDERKDEEEEEEEEWT